MQYVAENDEGIYIHIYNSICAPSVTCGRKSREIRGDFNGDCDFYPVSMHAACIETSRKKKIIRCALEVLKNIYILREIRGSLSG